MACIVRPALSSAPRIIRPSSQQSIVTLFDAPVPAITWIVRWVRMDGSHWSRIAVRLAERRWLNRERLLVESNFSTVSTATE